MHPYKNADTKARQHSPKHVPSKKNFFCYVNTAFACYKIFTSCLHVQCNIKPMKQVKHFDGNFNTET